MTSDLGCGSHTAYAYRRGGKRRLFELEPLTLVRWHRVRDDISTAEVTVSVDECCGRMDDLRTILHELHIYRNGEPVWEGVITRLEYEWNSVSIFAEDILWPTKRAAIHPGYNNMWPNRGLVLDVVDTLLNQAYSRQGDPWNMRPAGGAGEGGHLHPIRTPGEPRLVKMMADWQDTVWNDVDRFGEDYGIDYTVVNRDVYYWDIHQAWKILPELRQEWISDPIRIVEYGNNLYTRAIVTNGRGYAGIDQAGDDVIGRNQYGLVDNIITEANDADTAEIPDDQQLREWQEQAVRSLANTFPPPVGVVIPDNTTLLADCPWRIEDLIPGAWFKVKVERICRQVTQWNRIQQISVEEIPPRGETVQMSSVTAPREMHRVPL